MSFGSLNDIIIFNTFIEEINTFENDIVFDNVGFPRTINAMRKEFPLISDDDLVRFLHLLLVSYMRNEQERVELVVTAPMSFSLHTKSIENIIEEMLKSAQKSIFITGYSISEYINPFLDLIINKSQQGILVKIYINNMQEQDYIDRLVRYKGRYLELYNYFNQSDKMSALHAKVIAVDSCKSLVSSANLSYHGMMGNIELGYYVESVRIANQISEVFKQLLFQKVFKKI